MTNVDIMHAAAETYLKTSVLGAGIFGLKDNYAAIAAAGALSATALDVADVSSSPLLEGVSGAAAVHAARDINAAAQGLDVRMLVAVTSDSIYVLKWDSPTNTVLATFYTFPKATTHVTITKFGASRNVTLEDPAGNQSVHLVGSAGFLSSEAAGDKLVLSLLS